MRKYHGHRKWTKAMRRWRRRLAKKDASCIPKGPYCYVGIETPPEDAALGKRRIKPCPYWRSAYDKLKGNQWMRAKYIQNYGYCEYIETGDWMLGYFHGTVPGGTFLLWDMCKSCNTSWDDEREQ